MSSQVSNENFKPFLPFFAVLTEQQAEGFISKEGHIPKPSLDTDIDRVCV